jgi:uncharacterized membrane protein YeaQ/YmgE (transglycosylase-associated protein family)
MSEERMPMARHDVAGSAPGSAPDSPGASGAPLPGSASPLDDPRALQILSTEHWSLLATRSLSWNESFSRAGLFLSVLSATSVALALVAQATSFDGRFVAFALVILPIDLFVGLATFTRLEEVNAEDAVWVAGMNRIRHAYLEMNEGLRPFFIAGSTDDRAGIAQTYGIHRPGNPLLHWLVTTPGMIAAINGALAGLIAGIILNQPGRMGMEPAIAAAGLVGVLVGAVLAARTRTGSRWFESVYRPAFPGPSGDGGGEDGAGKPGT